MRKKKKKRKRRVTGKKAAIPRYRVLLLFLSVFLKDEARCMAIGGQGLTTSASCAHFSSHKQAEREKKRAGSGRDDTAVCPTSPFTKARKSRRCRQIHTKGMILLIM